MKRSELNRIIDDADNFSEYSGRLPAIEEDEAPRYLIFNDYAVLMRPDAWPPAWK